MVGNNRGESPESGFPGHCAASFFVVFDVSKAKWIIVIDPRRARGGRKVLTIEEKMSFKTKPIAIRGGDWVERWNVERNAAHDSRISAAHGKKCSRYVRKENNQRNKWVSAAHVANIIFSAEFRWKALCNTALEVAKKAKPHTVCWRSGRNCCCSAAWY